MHHPGFMDAALDRRVNALMRATHPPRARRGRSAAAAQRLAQRAALQGPAALTARERMALLSDPAALARLYRELRDSPAAREAWHRSDSAPYRPYARTTLRWKTT